MEEFFSNPKGYPKLTKRKRDGDGDEEEGSSPSKKRKSGKEVDYLDEKRNGSGEDYMRLSFESLYEEFAYVPLDFIKKTFFKTALYVPAYYAIKAATEMDPRPYKTKLAPYKSKGKSKAKYNAEWDAERSWLVERLQKVEQDKNDKIAEELHQKEVEESGEGIECGCCFGIAPFEKCVQCDEGHLFCIDCIEAHANNELGAQKTDILCMDGDGCKAPFPESELARTLPAKTMSLLQRLIQQKHIKDAGLEGLESCPFCDFSICIENPNEKLFNCQACEKVSCRSCKKEEHLPKSCEEMAKDNKLDHRHHIEEEMTKALIRVCPNTTCKTPALKEQGCNKMTCTACRTVFCYVCSAVITDYSHFDQSPADYSKPKDKDKCPLWEDMNVRHAKEVADARDRAQAELKARGGDIADEDIDVALPDPVAVQPAGYIPIGLPHGGRPAPAPAPLPAGPVPAAYRAAINIGANAVDADIFAQAAGLLGPRAMAHLPGYAPPPPPPRLLPPPPRARAPAKRPVGRPRK
ncbi:hypothetical protein BDY24DRAFT_383722 [Mrakia frigida]|uniref:E3 ubiquitin-protein ligase RNF216 n=1 Tax=Mrakia frigida TaxID=29902 RepID=UPI003FCBF000